MTAPSSASPAAPYAERVAATNDSVLRGASHASDMVHRALALGLPALGIADRNTVAGVVRAFAACNDAPQKGYEAYCRHQTTLGLPIDVDPACFAMPLRLLVGARLVFADGTPDIVAYPMTRRGWGRLTRLLTVGNLRAVKGGCILRFADLLEYLQDLQLIVLPTSTFEPVEAHRHPVEYQTADTPAPPTGLRLVAERPPDDLATLLLRLRGRAPDRVWLGLVLPNRGEDARIAAGLVRIARQAKVPLLATSDALYAAPEQRPLQDVLTCIRLRTTIAEAGQRLEVNAERYLRDAGEMDWLYRHHPQVLAETLRFAGGIRFDLSQLSYEYPHEPVPQGWEPDDWLEHLTVEAAHERYGPDLPETLTASLRKELDFIREQRIAYYFLTVHDLVKFARSQDPPILCQGRGSAANSTVCFLLGVTSIDPTKHDLLFERFLSSERKEPPDIDVDFEHERRERVIEYIYDRYGRHRAGIAATVAHYRARSTVRAVAKALGLSEDIPARLAGTVWGSHSGDMEDHRIAEAGFDLHNPQIARLRLIMEQLLETAFPRHLSQHVGGFVLTQDRLDETVPLHNGAMPGRTFLEWDKDDIDT
jgi:error-prone DNA polymerase